MPTIDAFVDSLALEELATDRYRAPNMESEHQIVFGGQLLAQSITAALLGQEEKTVKTIHTVFARSANPATPLEVAVDRLHSGRSIASCTVTISQDDRICTRSMVLLSAAEPDVIRHADAPSEPTTPPGAPVTIRSAGAWEIAMSNDVDVNDPDQVGPPDLDVWMRYVDAPNDPGVDQSLVAFGTDGFLIGTAMRPHHGVGQAQAHKTLSTGVLSHTLTFHEPCRASAWHLVSHHSSYAGGGRSYGRGDIFQGEGQLVASFVQDAMIRTKAGGPGGL